MIDNQWTTGHDLGLTPKELLIKYLKEDGNK